MFLKKIPANFYFLLISLLYYIFFVNKGIVIYDEGYYAHIAERILDGQIPYRDFFVQFTPGYFYLLALFYKLFGLSILTGRIVTLIICIGIVYLILRLIDKYKLNIKLKILSFFAVLSFGFPLINNMSLLAWPTVFLSLLMVLFFAEKKYIFLGIVLSLILFTKQNIGIYFFFLTNLFLITSKINFRKILLFNLSFLALTLIWFSYFFLILNKLDRFIELLSFNSKYLSVYRFSYPPLSFLLHPTGVFKLLPYYLPVFFALFAIKDFFTKKKNMSLLYFSAVSIVGFFGTVFPTSDLLHVYPFFGILVVSFILFFNNKLISPISRIIFLLVTGITILIGMYLIRFGNYYRYQPPYSDQRTKLELPRASNIYVDQSLAFQLSSLNLFLLINTKKTDSILCYPFCPMAYFIFQRNNPSRFSTYYPGYLTEAQEKGVLNELKQKKTKYVLTFLDYKFKTPISEFIQKQKEMYKIEQFKVFEIQ